MSARHTSPGLFRRVALPVAALLGVIAAAGVTVVALRVTSGADCSGALPLKVAVTPAALDVVNAAAQEYQRSQPVVNGRCVQVQVESRNAADVAHELPTAQINPHSLWIPDSSMWAAEAQRQSAETGPEAPKLDIKPSLASSPLVVAGSESTMAKVGYPITPISWSKVIDPKVAVSMSDPTMTSEGLATLFVIRTLLGNADGTPKPELVGTLLRVGRTAIPSVRDAFSKATTDAEKAPLFAATEQSIVANNRSMKQNAVLGAPPREGTLSFDYPLVRVSRQNEQDGIGEAAAEFERVLRSGETTKRFGEAGFRTVSGAAPAKWSTEVEGVQAGDVKQIETPNADQVSELLRTWGAISLDMRMLTVIDVSGSMIEKGANGKTRVEAATEASMTALSMLPDTTQIGLWAFSTDKKPPQDWIELVPVGPLGEPLQGVARRKRLEAGASQLNALVGGGTALNDTTLAAFRHVLAGYDPSKVNSVVLMTDGRNDDISSIDTAALIETLKRESDPARPVPIIMVGLGQEADMDALRAISAATGGKAYQAPNPEDIRAVLLDAVSQRRCRPNC
ncbi:VWA domain-containing protein [Lentzea guizhouensis]|uniref:VWA domain-containing protein n=1 Tax=Lentzea guizhouensis TaxID=1586287 RepID=A0A1B2HGD2_9PSEU|nr:substrate-binding domain-containing protein [Lentzea guizhouensis]ANZ36777.1 VWA domain-containing protein [Lentzea guizhouensis]